MKSLRFKHIFFIGGLLLLSINFLVAQKVGINKSSVVTDAVLEINGLVGSSYKGMIPPKMTTTQRNSIGATTDGLTIYNTQAKTYQVFDGSNWNNIGIPTGAILMWSGTLGTIPAGWVLCDGTNGTPDLRERFVVGAGGNNSSVTGGEYTVEATGGVNDVTLSVGQLPTHSHGAGTLVTDNSGEHRHSYPIVTGTATSDKGVRNGNDSNTNRTSSLSGEHSHAILGNTADAGGNSPHENRPPYLALAYIMKL